MAAETKTPEVQEVVHPDLVEFSARANQLITYFNAMHTGGLDLPDGTVSGTSLRSARDNLVSQAQTDPSTLALVKAVNGAEREGVTPEDSAELGLLKLFGGATEKEQKVFGESQLPTTPERARRVGHQVLVNGRVVRGSIGSRPHEVVTSAGILRTHGTPRLAN